MWGLIGTGLFKISLVGEVLIREGAKYNFYDMLCT